MILTKVLTIDEAYRSIDWMTVFLLAGLIPLGLAFQKTRGCPLGGRYHHAERSETSLHIIFLLIIGVLTSFFTLFVSNVGATLSCWFHSAWQWLLDVGCDPRLAAMVVALAASNTFVLPTHQVNALIMRPGGYQTIDYIRAGTGMTIMFLVVLITMLLLFY